LHAFMNAAIRIANKESLSADNIESVRALVADAAVPLVCEPMASKLKPAGSYAAQFSLPYSVACALQRSRFGLHEIEAPSYTDASLLALAQKVTYEIDPNSGFPKSRSGELIVKMKDGRTLRERDDILPDEPASAEAIVAKFEQNCESTMARADITRLCDVVLGMARVAEVNELTRLLGATTALSEGKKMVNA